MKWYAKLYTRLVFIFLYLPIIVLIAFSFNESKSRRQLDRLLLPLV